MRFALGRAWVGFCLLILKQAMELRFESITRWLATPSMDMRGSQYLWACRSSLSYLPDRNIAEAVSEVLVIMYCI